MNLFSEPNIDFNNTSIDNLELEKIKFNISNQNPIIDEDICNVFLIGSTQNGKSNLANFLYYGDVYRDKECKFKIGEGYKSCTTTVKNEKTNHIYYKYENQSNNNSKKINIHEYYNSIKKYKKNNKNY